MCGKPFVFYNMSKTYKVYDINLSLRKQIEAQRFALGFFRARPSGAPLL